MVTLKNDLKANAGASSGYGMGDGDGTWVSLPGRSVGISGHGGLLLPASGRRYRRDERRGWWVLVVRWSQL